MGVSKKALYKTISWRIVSIMLSLTLSLLIMGSWRQAVSYTLIYSALSSILYYYHEMLYKWLRQKGKL
jgi:uncharacterized membrane protein